MITKDDLASLPGTIGVYLFEKNKTVNYIGKSVNIKARVSSHLENSKSDNKEKLIINNSDSIKVITAESEFKALIMEAELIKKFQPKYNSIWKDDKSPLYIKITAKDEYPKIFLTRKPSVSEIKNGNMKNLFFGPFSSTKTAETIISDIRKIIPFCTQKNIGKKNCFYSKIGLCNPCPNFINQSRDGLRLILKKKYRKNIHQVISILKGNIKTILKDLYQQLNIFIKNNQYEEAITVRNKIFRFNRLLDLNDNSQLFQTNNNSKKTFDRMLAIFKKYFPRLVKLDRIETYDISNLGLDHAAGSMVVMKNNRIDKSEYRRFKIRQSNFKSDFERLKEVIGRRLKQSWPVPDLIIIDGGRPQIKSVIKIFQANKIDIPVIGIAKNPDRLIAGTSGLPDLFLKNDSQILNIIRMLRDESHRFARKYHLFLRSKDFLL